MKNKFSTIYLSWIYLLVYNKVVEMKYDLLIKGGRVLDPGQEIDEELDIAITGEIISAIEKDISNEAKKIIGDIDQDDVTFIALALAIPNNGIWTEDKHFKKQNKIKIWSTKEILDLLNTMFK